MRKLACSFWCRLVRPSGRQLSALSESTWITSHAPAVQLLVWFIVETPSPYVPHYLDSQARSRSSSSRRAGRGVRGRALQLCADRAAPLHGL